MKDQITAAVLFLSRLIGNSGSLNEEQMEQFKNSLCNLLQKKFDNHWFPEKPCKGQAFRCIRINETERRDPVLEQAASSCGLKYEDLKLPIEITIWVDPNEVCCRFGEHEGSFCTVASFKDDSNQIYDINIEELQHKSEHKNYQVSPKLQSKSDRVQSKYLRQSPVRYSYCIKDSDDQQSAWLRESPFQYEDNGSVTPPFSPVKQLGTSPRQDRYHWVNRSLVRA